MPGADSGLQAASGRNPGVAVMAMTRHPRAARYPRTLRLVVPESAVDVDVLDDPLLNAHPELMLLQKFAERIPINEIDWRHAVACRFLTCRRRERGCRD